MINLLDSEAIYNRADELRKERGWSIYELSKKAGVTPNAIYHWRDRKSSPTLALLDSVCEAYGISVVTFLTDADELIALTDEQRELVAEFSQLSREQKSSVLALMKSIKREFGNK